MHHLSECWAGGVHTIPHKTSGMLINNVVNIVANVVVSIRGAPEPESLTRLSPTAGADVSPGSPMAPAAEGVPVAGAVAVGDAVADSPVGGAAGVGGAVVSSPEEIPNFSVGAIEAKVAVRPDVGAALGEAEGALEPNDRSRAALSEEVVSSSIGAWVAPEIFASGVEWEWVGERQTGNMRGVEYFYRYT